MKLAIGISSFLGVLFFGAMIYFMLHAPFNDASGIPNSELFERYGSFIGGLFGTLFSALSFAFLLITLYQQKKQFSRERFEGQLFEMIKLHRDNVSEQSFTYSKRGKRKELKEFTGIQRKVFRLIFFQYEELCKEMHHIYIQYQLEDIYEPGYLALLEKQKNYKNNAIDLKTLGIHDLLYMILFFGAGKSGISTITSFCEGRYLSGFYEPILYMASLKPKEESEKWYHWRRLIEYPDGIKEIAVQFIMNDRQSSLVEKRSGEDYSWAGGFGNYEANIYYADDYEKYYGGHQHRLGHYFRHLFYTVNFINRQSGLQLNEKRTYVKLLRTQISTYEQVLFFLNSLSIIGRAWELEDKSNPSNEIPIDSLLITKYNLIRNIYSNEIVPDLNAASYYPYVKYEAFSLPNQEEKRKVLEKSWN